MIRCLVSPVWRAWHLKADKIWLSRFAIISLYHYTIKWDLLTSPHPGCGGPQYSKRDIPIFVISPIEVNSSNFAMMFRGWVITRSVQRWHFLAHLGWDKMTVIGLVPSWNKPLPEPVLAKISAVVGHIDSSMYYELIQCLNTFVIQVDIIIGPWTRALDPLSYLLCLDCR